MRIKSSNNNKPGDLSLRVDSKDEREVLAKIFPEFGIQKYTSHFDKKYPLYTSLQYNVVKSLEDSNEIMGIWTGWIGWDKFPRSLEVFIQATWQFEPQMGWKIKVRLGDGYTEDYLQEFSLYEKEVIQKRSRANGPVNARQAVCNAIKSLVESL